MIKLSKETIKRIKAQSFYSQEDFIKDCKTYIKAVQSGRILYTATHVSASGCGMDMLFATNYDIIHTLHRMKFISKAKCETLAQKV